MEITAPADTYLVVNRTIMNDNDRLILTKLYQPLISFKALALYYSLWSNIDSINIMSVELNHRHLMNMTGFSMEEIIESRHKLEAIGLLKTAFKKGTNNIYIYQLYSPLSAEEFLSHPFLNPLLQNTLGVREYKRIVNEFKLPKIDLTKYDDITCSFSDVFSTDNLIHNSIDEEIKRREVNKIAIINEIDFNFIKESLPKDLISNNLLTESVKELISSISYLYQIDNVSLIGLIRNSINENGLIDEQKFVDMSHKYYMFENDNNVPRLIYTNQPHELRTNTKDNSLRSKMINTFESLTPYDFLRGKYNGANPTSIDIKMVESLLIDLKLLPGVINVLIDYVLRINDYKLNKNFVTTIAGQWKRLNIKTVEAAMKQAEKDHKKYKEYKQTTKFKNVSSEKVPDWFDKNIKEEKLSTEEENKVIEKLQKFS